MEKKIIIPEGITNINEEFFTSNRDVEEIVLPDSVTTIDDDAFKDLINLKRIRLSNNLRTIGNGAFDGCISLEEISIPTSLTYLSHSLFKGCKSLKRINLHDGIEYIDDFALAGCTSLTKISLPKRLKSLGICALARCSSIEEIFIPDSVEEIEIASLSEMSSLKRITVDTNNKKYMSDEDVALIDKEDGLLIQYAIASDKEEYIVGYYPLRYDETIQSHELTCNILNFAFMGAKNLRRLCLPSEIESIGPDTFNNCPNLKDLRIFYTSYGKVLLLRVMEVFNHHANLNFENIVIDEGVTSLADDMSFLFKNAKSVTLPDSLEEIGSNVFRNCPNLKTLSIPRNVRSISANAFDDHILLDINGFKQLYAKDILMLTTQIDKDFRRKSRNKYDSKVLSMKDGTYYVFLNDFAPIKISKDEIKSVSSNSSILSDEPEVFLDYLIDLLSINATHHEQLMKIIMDEDLKATFEKLFTDLKYIKEIANSKHENVIRELLSHTGDNEFLFNGIVMRNLSKADIVHIIDNMNPTLMHIIRVSDMFNSNIDSNDPRIKPVIDNIPKLTAYSTLLDRYKLNDRFLYNHRFFIGFPLDYQMILLNHFNQNIKRMIIKSKILESPDIENRNLIDLIKLSIVLGVFSDDEKISQRATTFITEKILELDTDYSINGDDIHRIFDGLNPRANLDKEFIDFFIENYKELITLEKLTSGFISRIYNSFEEIKKYSSSNKGEQRNLKVTIQRCQNFFLLKTYHNVTDENIVLARALARFFDDEKLLDIAISILEESKSAPRNIFGRYAKDEDGNLVFENSESEDLKGKVNDYSYEWLPKQDSENLFLGKYCNCCAHIAGEGAGIMRASMTTDCVQNLVIRDSLGIIIGKMTLWINREMGYGVFNTAEINLNHRTDDRLKMIYEAFREATLSFIRTYNTNNPDKPISDISIGKHRNVLKSHIEMMNDVSNDVNFESMQYGTHGYFLGNNYIGKYNGDAHIGQMLIYKK